MKVFCVILLFSIFTSSCKKSGGKSQAPPRPTVTTEPDGVPVSTDLIQFKNRFFDFAATTGASLTTTGLTLEYSTDHTTTDGVLGVCTRTSGKRDVTINKVYWEAWAAKGRSSDMEQLMFHELGHCTLLRGHFDTNTGEIAQSIMNSYHVNKVFYLANYNHYIDELFNPALAGTVVLNSNGSDGFDGSVYASTLGISTYTMRESQEFYDSNVDIEEFRCEEDHL